MNGLLISGVGLSGLMLGGYALARTVVTGTATLRGGRRISRARNAQLYWCNVAALCALLLISAGLIFLGMIGFGL